MRKVGGLVNLKYTYASPLCVAAVTTWTGWAMSSITSKLYKSSGTGGMQAASSSGTKSQSQEGQLVEGGGRDKVQGRTSGQREGEREGKEKEEDGSQDEDGEGWDDEQWEVRMYSSPVFNGYVILFALFIQDFNIPGEQIQTRDSGGLGMGEGGGDGDMEEWEDDGWGTFEVLDDNKSVPSSGADFFDTFESVPKKKESEDLFEQLGVGGGRRGKKPSPPPVSANLFGSSGAGGWKEEKAGNDWGDWGSDFSSKQVQYVWRWLIARYHTILFQEPVKQQHGHALKLGSKQAVKGAVLTI